MDVKQCGAFIREQRTARGLSQQQLAGQLHVTREAVSKWETGRGFPDVSLLRPLAEALGVGVGELLAGERGADGEAALEAWLFRSQEETARQRPASRALLLGVLTAAVLCLVFDLRWLIVPLGLLAVGLPLALALNERFSLQSLVLSSFGCCAAVIGSELRLLWHRVQLRDWSGLGDTMSVTISVCVGLLIAVWLSNALLLSGRRR